MSKRSHIKMNKLNHEGKLFHIFLSVVTALTLLINSPLIMNVAMASQGENQGNFIIRVTLIDDSRIDIDHVFYDLVDIYVKEHPEYGHFNMDLSDALYSDTSNGEYTTDIVMPSGIIDVNETFHICIEGPVTDEGNGVICYNLLNNPQRGPEEITIRV
ncbi:MAG TPA: hypothetical protein VFG45_05005 [Candidatus Nitrosocosmicus sp.]|uniref:hypothetical protein n=1 Tax=Candidatus Nitrosocosmicus agrestis TaxID=2563600 RepID=UPI00122DD498|nr:hypothetical protein [Candidatus Nitrosocosmicus sp. SS]KAA2279543.1 hypothetical protein F1Z66_13205 [Candidatus Nitrosocosmicus sp. SS]HET6589505.1 hypothetical protein [Candidatus Nitrosocosmicus sp.]